MPEDMVADGKRGRVMKIGDEVYVHGYVDEIRKDCVIIRNDGGYFGTVPNECYDYKEDALGYGTMNEAEQTEPSNSEKPNNCDEPQTELVNDSPILVKDLVDDEFNPYDEECMRCKHLKLKCEFIPTYCKFESRDEPQTDEEYINSLPWTEVGNGEQTDEPQTGCPWK